MIHAIVDSGAAAGRSWQKLAEAGRSWHKFDRCTIARHRLPITRPREPRLAIFMCATQMRHRPPCSVCRLCSYTGSIGDTAQASSVLNHRRTPQGCRSKRRASPPLDSPSERSQEEASPWKIVRLGSIFHGNLVTDHRERFFCTEACSQVESLNYVNSRLCEFLCVRITEDLLVREV